MCTILAFTDPNILPAFKMKSCAFPLISILYLLWMDCAFRQYYTAIKFEIWHCRYLNTCMILALTKISCQHFQQNYVPLHRIYKWVLSEKQFCVHVCLCYISWFLSLLKCCALVTSLLNLYMSILITNFYWIWISNGKFRDRPHDL